MSAISLKSISGITSITTPAGVDDQLTLHNNNTTERVKIDVAGNVHVNNHLAVAGVTTFAGNIELTGALNNDLARIKIPDGMNGAPFTGNLEFGNNRDFVILHDSHHNYIKANTGNVYVTCGGNTLTTLLASGTVLLNKDLDVDGHTNLDNVSISGITTISHTGSNQLTIKDSNSTGNAAEMRISFKDSGDTEKFFVGSNESSNSWFYLGTPSGQNQPVSIRINGSDRFQVNSNGVSVNGSYYVQDSLIHDGDTDTKIRFPANDTITFETAGTERARIKSDGKVLIGGTLGLGGATSSPNGVLHAQTSSGEAKVNILGATNGVIQLSGYAGNSTINFGDSSSDTPGRLQYNHGSDSFHIRTGSNNRLHIMGNGDYGFNDSSPTANASGNDTVLSIKGKGSSYSGKIDFKDSSGNIDNHIASDNAIFMFNCDPNSQNGNTAMLFSVHGSERLRIDSAGRVMVNQTTNQTGTAKLEVMGTGDNTYPQYSFAIGVGDTQDYNVSNGAGMGIGFTYKWNTSGQYALGCGIRGFKENTTDGNYAGAMAFYTRPNGAGAGEKARLSSAGTFGVGTANPDSNYKIDCNGRLRIGDGNAGHRIQFSRSGLGDELVIGVDGYGSSTNNEAVIQSSINSGRPLVFRTSNGDRLRIAANGRVGVQETEAKIGGFAENLQVRATYGGGQYGIAVKLNQSSGALMRFATKNPTDGNDNLCGNISGNGTSCSYNTSSDYRLKENDVKISDGISRLKQLRPIRFNWKSDSSFTQDGFFAHEVSPVVPESVTGEKDATVDSKGEGYQNIDHSKLVPLLTAALQEAVARIEALEGS